MGSETFQEEIRISEQEGGRFLAEYMNLSQKWLSGLGSFGKTAAEAKSNLITLITEIKKQMLRAQPEIRVVDDDGILFFNKK